MFILMREIVCYSAPLISWGDSKRKMVRMMSGSPMRVKTTSIGRYATSSSGASAASMSSPSDSSPSNKTDVSNDPKLAETIASMFHKERLRRAAPTGRSSETYLDMPSARSSGIGS